MDCAEVHYNLLFSQLWAQEGEEDQLLPAGFKGRSRQEPPSLSCVTFNMISSEII